MVLIYVLVAFFLFSCTDWQRDHAYDPNGVNYVGDGGTESTSSSAVLLPSSSSIAPSSSSSVSSSSGIVLLQSSSSYDPSLVKLTITLSLAGSSYADLDDAAKMYKQNDVLGGDIKEKIDLVAYCGSSARCIGDVIYNPYEINIFYGDYNYLGGDYLGGDSFFFPLSASVVNLLNSATKVSDIADLVNNLENYIDMANELFEVPIIVGTGFLVYTTEMKYFAVIISASGAQTVTLNIIELKTYP